MIDKALNILKDKNLLKDFPEDTYQFGYIRTKDSKFQFNFNFFVDDTIIENIAKYLNDKNYSSIVIVARSEKEPFTNAFPKTYKLEQFIDLMDVFLLSSLSEGTSMTLLEAMSLGKPCVVTDAGGNAEVVTHNTNGLVTENDNKNAFAAAISQLTQRHEMRENFGENAIEKFELQFSAQKMNEAFRVQYNNLMPSVQ